VAVHQESPAPEHPQAPGQHIVKKEGKVQIVACEEKHTGFGLKVLPTLAIKKGEFRNRKIAGISSEMSPPDLRSWCQQSGIQTFCIFALKNGGSEAVLFDTPKNRLKEPPNNCAGTVQDKQIVSQVCNIVANAETWRTVEIEKDESSVYAREEVMEMIRPYVRLNRAEFEAELIALRTQKDTEDFTVEHAFILANEMKMKSLRAAMVELEIAKSFLTSVDDDSLLPIEKFTGLQDLSKGVMPWGQ